MASIRLALVASVFAAAQAAYGNSFSITKIADTKTPIPGGGGDFTNFVLSSGDTFIAEGSDNQDGIYTFDPLGGRMGRLAASGMVAPGLPSNVTFSSFSSVSFGGEGVSFVANNSDGSQAVYEDWLNNNPILVATTGQSPSSGVTFSEFTNVSSTYQNNSPLNPTGEFLSNAGVYFFSIGSVGQNSYAGAPVTLQLEANTSTIPQGASAPFSMIGMPNFKAGFPSGTTQGPSSAIQSMVATVNGTLGVYISIPGSASSAPGAFSDLTAGDAYGVYTSIGNPVANDGALVFTAHLTNDGVGSQAIFVFDNYYFGGGRTIGAFGMPVSTNTIAPGSGGAYFQNFLGVTPDGLFLAQLTNGTEGIYALTPGNNGNIDGPVSDVIDTTDILDGKTIASFELSPEADYYADGTAIIVNFTDGSQGLYFEQSVVPEPTVLALLVLPLAVRRRREVV